MQYETLDLRREDALTWLTLNRPQALDAMNGALADELRHSSDATLALTKRGGKQGDADVAGRQADADEGRVHARRLAGESHVGGQRQGEAAPGGRAVDAGDEGLGRATAESGPAR